MAIVKSTLLTTASGSIAGATFAHSRGALTVRGRGGMTNPNSTAQQQARSALTAAVQAWNSLTAAQRTAWTNYATNTPTTNRVGDTIYLSGQNQFCRQYQLATRVDTAIENAGGTPLAYATSDAPTLYTTGQPVASIDEVLANATQVEFTATAADDGSGETRIIVIQIGAPQNAGKTFFKGPYTLAAAFEQDPQAAVLNATLVFATGGDWLAAYQPQSGDRLPIRTRLLYSDGRLSAATQQIVTVGTSI